MKYIISYVIGFVLIIVGAVNLFFQLDSFEYNVTPTAEDGLNIEVITINLNDIEDSSKYSFFYNGVTIDDSIEDDELKFYVSSFYTDEFEIQKYKVGDDRTIIEFYAKDLKKTNFIMRLVDQYKNKKIFYPEYLHDVHVIMKCNGITYEKIRRY